MKRWPTKPLGELGDLRGGGTPSRKVPQYFQGDIPWITGADVTDLYVNKAREFITPEAIENSATTLLPKNTVLVVSRTGVGKIGIAATPLCASQDLTGIICGKFVRPEYLARCLLARADSLTNAAQGATIRGITRQFLSRVEIPVPPLAEQGRIVKVLDEADELRKLRAQAARRTAAPIPALFHEMFGDPERNPKGWPVSHAGELMADCDYGTSQKANEDGRGMVVLRMGNVTSTGELDLEKLKTVELSDDELAWQRLHVGDVLFNRTNSRDLVGKTGMWDGRMEAVAASYFIRVRFRSDAEHPQHFTTFMNLPAMKHRLAEMARGSIGQANINSKELQAIEVPVPPLALQKEFAARVTEIRAVQTEQAASRQRLENLFQSLLHRAFNGEI